VTYVILGHLVLRSWSTYELAQQMQRGTRHYWPRAESKFYEQPKKLVAHGLATATREYTGRRPRTVYAITDQGRESLRRWLDQPGLHRSSSPKARSRRYLPSRAPRSNCSPRSARSTNTPNRHARSTSRSPPT
jgi:DNA-binding PadR family transcriptional regulator